MLQTLTRHPKAIAWFFVSLFYLQLVLIPVVTRANARPLPAAKHIYGADTWKAGRTGLTANINKEIKKEINSAPEKAVTGKKTGRFNSPGHVHGTVTTGPTQPEMQSFQSVNSNNLVDPFTGDFSYNIPLLDVGGYPVNLHYQSGVTMDQEASWVGLGWNINPGVISRNMRGLPDDFQGGEDKITKTVSIKPNRTFGAAVGTDVEVVGVPIISGGLGFSSSIFYNNYKGWGLERSMHMSIGASTGSKGHLSAGLSLTSNTQSGVTVGRTMGFQLGARESMVTGGITIGTSYNSRTGIQNLQITGEMKGQAIAGKNLIQGTPLKFGSSISFSKPSYTPTISIPYTSTGYTFRAKAGAEAEGLFASKSFQGYTSTEEVENKIRVLPAYGYLYYEKAGRDQNVLLDYNLEKDIAWTENAPHIAVPIYTYDTWSITGEGTGGMFRPYRSDIGFVFDHKMSTKSKMYTAGVNAGLGSIAKGGYDYNQVYSVTNSNAWMGDNRMVEVIPFRPADTTFENVYFKNPGEKTAVDKLYQKALGGDNLMRVDLNASDKNRSVTATRFLSLFKNARVTDKISFDLNNTVRKQRDKRTQVISYLTAREAVEAGLDKTIRSYSINSFPQASCSNYTPVNRVDNSYRRPHHLSEITVLNPDGRRYVYGIPVYNRNQVEVTMTTEKGKGDNATGLVSYDKTKDNTENNSQGKDGYFNREVMPAYSHSFLLSGILSSDYVDLTDDGITEDDNGDAVKFNYSQVYSLDAPYRWRAPYQQNLAAYNEGLKTDSRDERGSYTYGEREVWYLNSVESKTMLATFVLDADRKDGCGVTDENGGRNADKKLYRLKEINLYTKADYLKNGSNARPIKTVHFEYSYELCKGNPGSLDDNGKLTLKKVWFTYNGSDKGKRNPYIFTYNNLNPGFSQKSVDRWGNYKDPGNNPGNSAMTNADFPYTLQTGVKSWNTDSAGNNAAPWTLSEIKLPSGGKLKVTYESDDYAYVQNKRAMQFFTIAGFGPSESSAPQPVLYPEGAANSDYRVVFINVTETVNTAADVKRKYLDGVTQLFLKLAVNMPGDRWGNGYELVPCYAEIESYGVASQINNNNKTIWVRVKPVNGKSPFATAAIQFLRLNLPSKAYPWSEPGDKLDVKAVVGLLTSMAGNVLNMLKGIEYENNARRNNRCNSLVPDRSFARLDNPVYKKFGGGLRVKMVELCDHWDSMARHGLQPSKYGQTYTYTDTVMINGVRTGISSGVASYEPMIGGDENPFHVPAKVYSEQVGALAPTNFMYAEEPFAETFFPGASVGYSKIRVQTIHKDKKSANGFDETEFYTTKDFPTLVEYTPIDNDSKKPFKSPIPNPYYFDSKNYVTLSQGFKIELNDMNGKPRSQASYSQNDPDKPISSTYNYYRLVNDNAGQPRLSNTVAIADSATGTIDTTGEIGKEVEIMVDVREQESQTASKSLEANVDVIDAGPFPVPIFTGIPLFNSETNRYRAISILKIVNRYGILDSIIHIEKGSQVTTRNLLYDGETGDVLLSQTNNEFDDPVYNFSYPAHWAYTGMGPAYRNIGTLLKDVYFRKGIMVYPDLSRVPVERYFESGDELLVYGNDKRIETTNDHCSPDYYKFTSDINYTKVWAVDASKGKQGQKGIYFIDRNGIPYSCDKASLRIIRSGKRNMAGVSAGSVTSLESPIRRVNNTARLVFDTATHVIAANAARFKDVWMVDSTTFAKDTLVIAARKMALRTWKAEAIDNYAVEKYWDGNNSHPRTISRLDNFTKFEAYSEDAGNGGWDSEVKSWLKFNMSNVPEGAMISSAKLYLFGRSGNPHKNYRNSNACYLERVNDSWMRDRYPNGASGNDLVPYFSEGGPYIDPGHRVIIPETPHGTATDRNDIVDITGMAQDMLNQYYSSNHVVSPAIRIRLVDGVGTDGVGNASLLTYNTQTSSDCSATDGDCKPYIEVQYYEPCADGSPPYYSETDPNPLGRVSTLSSAPSGGYYCNDELVHSTVCRPNINDTAVNFYRFGILGNWRLDRAYTYYSDRKGSNLSDTTNIRAEGEIKDFAPYWGFTNSLLAASTDETRWVWNSEMTRFNNKGYEIENHDPLDRYNTGIYGYNQTLPIAVAQNARNREIAFDGFEDYGYQTDNCKTCLLNRHIDLGSAATLVDTVSHTGLYSLRVNGNDAVVKTFAIGQSSQGVVPELSMKEDSIPFIDTLVIGNGAGFSLYSSMDENCDNVSDKKLLSFTSNINYDSEIGPMPLPSCRYDNFGMMFQGYIQPRYTGVYTFYTTADDRMSMHINRNGVDIDLTGNFPSPGETVEGNHDYTTPYHTRSVALQAGELYLVTILWTIGNNPNHLKLEWESQGLHPQAREVVPATQLYPNGSNFATVKAATVFPDTTWCVQFKNPTAVNATHKRFSPVQGQKVVVSAWVKQETDCISGSYDNAQLNLAFNNEDGDNYFQLKPSGAIIEGWQRIEDTLTIPANATSVTWSMNATSSAPVYFDDLRITPFNGNMRSFVYNPVNLRLMAELDENNYATFYEYDDEGTLIRLKKETERGIKTIKETRSALLKE